MVLLTMLFYLSYLVRSADELFIQEFTNITPLSGIKQTTCTTNFWVDYKNNHQLVGFYTNADNAIPFKRSYSNIPAHWSLALSFELILLEPGIWATSSFIKVMMETTQAQIFQKQTVISTKYWCRPSKLDQMALFHKNITHTTSTFDFTLKQQFSLANEGFALRNVIIHIETCHATCLTCNGPTENNCQTCPPNSTQTGNKCQCNNGYFASKNSCVTSCPTGYYGRNLDNSCIEDYCSSSRNCQICSATPAVCSTCATGYYLFYDQCLSKCPSYAPASGQICQDKVKALTNGAYLLQGLTSNTFGESEIIGMGFQISGFLGLGLEQYTSSSQVFSNCNGIQIFGGQNLSGKGANIKWTYPGTLAPHSSIKIIFQAYIIDSWDNEYFFVKVNGYYESTQKFDFNYFYAPDGFQMCGLDEYIDTYYLYEILSTNTDPTLTIEITPQLDEQPYNESFGIREFAVLINYCQPTCQECYEGGCITCISGYYVSEIDGQCYNPCPAKTFLNTATQTCSACHTSCQTCTGNANNQCASCPTGKYLLNQTCVDTCLTSGYFIDNVNFSCQACHSSCYRCSAPTSSTSCTQCSTNYLYLGSCIASCPAGSIIQTTSNDNKCILCDSNCKTCNGNAANNCLSCFSPKILQTNNTCVSSCSSNQYVDTTNNKCVNCDSTCMACTSSGPSACSSCSSPKYLSGTQCSISCPSNQFGDNSDNTCKGCNSNCLTCQNTATQCLTCQPPLVFQPANQSCVSSCNSNQFKDTSTQSCKSCNTSCASCNGPSNNQCTSCLSGTYLYGTSCVPSCPTSGYFEDSVNNKCSVCDLSCYKCSAENNPVTCTQCSSGYLYNQSCIASCPSNTFSSTTTNDNKCITCHSNCNTCNGNASNNCLSCLSPKILQLDNTCVLSCLSSQYVDTTQNKCTNCNAACLTCSGGALNNCTSCSSPYFLTASQCLPTCPNGQYGDTTTNTCKNCNSNCLTCSSSPTQCATCQSPLILQPLSSTCVASCNPDQYKDGATNTCKSCNISCKTCSGPYSNQCLSCNTGTFLQAGQCVSNCSANYYGDTNDNICKNCNSTCNTCTGSNSNNCLTCNTPYLYQPILKTCVSSCNSNQFLDVPSNSCQNCDTSCATCTGPTPSQCTQCPPADGTYLDNNECVSTCPSNKYADVASIKCQLCNTNCKTCVGIQTRCTSCISSMYLDSSSKTCKNCEPTCATCDGFANNNCLTCSSPLIYQPSLRTCVNSCNSNQYQDVATNTCLDCNASCLQCSGSNSNQCTACSFGMYLQNSFCVYTCLSNFFADNVTNTCKLCDSNCKTCVNSSTQCTSCLSTQYLDINTNICVNCDTNCASCDGASNNNCLTCKSPQLYQKYLKTCVNSCNSNQYLEATSKSCINCDSTCATCSGPNSSECLSCSAGRFLEGNSCVTACSINYYGDSLTSSCLICNSNCKTCNNSATQCTSCISSQFLDIITKQCENCDPSCLECSGPNSNQCTKCPPSKYMTKQQECVEICPAGYFNQLTTMTCELCQLNCKTCSQFVQTECTSCKLPLILQNSSKTCVSACDNNQFKDNSSNSCINCNSSCLTCNGPSSLNCLTCRSDMYLSNQSCLQCDLSCLTCNGGTSQNCLSCQIPNHLDTNTNSCVPTCPNSTFLDKLQNKCLPCNQNCLTCSGPSNLECLSCKNNESIYQNKCIKTCPTGFYSNGIQCNQCDKSCLECNGSTSSSCTKCTTNHYNFKNKCVLQCPSDTYEDKLLLQCGQCDKSCGSNGCIGKQPSDCLDSKVDYSQSLIIMIVSVKTGFWFLSSFVGFFLDRKDEGIYKEKIARVMKQQKLPNIQILDNQIESILEKQIYNPQEKIGIRRKRTKLLTNNFINLQRPQGPSSTVLSSINIIPPTNKDEKSSNDDASPSKINRTYRDFLSSAQNINNQSQFITNADCSPTKSPSKFQLNYQGKSGSNFNQTFQEFPDQEMQLAPSTNSPRSDSEEQTLKANYGNKLKYTLIGSELIEIWMIYNPDMNRVFRASLIYQKYLAFIFSTQYAYSEGNVLYLIVCLLFGLVIKGITYKVLISMNICFRYGAVLATFIIIGVSAADIYLWFIPQVTDIKWNKDFTWSVYYLIVFGVDLIFIQSIFALIKYISSIRSLIFKEGFFQKLLNHTFTSKGILLKIEEKK